MALEMLDVNSMDTGRYRAMIIQDPNDRQAVSGFVKMAQVMSGRSVAAGQTGWGSINVLDVDILRDMLNEYTGIKAEFLGTIMYDDERIMEVPILIQVLVNSGLAYLLNRQVRSPHCVAGPSALIGASNFFELAVATAIALFGFESGAALATVVGVLIEVPVMLVGVRVVNNSRQWYESRDGIPTEHFV